MNSNVALCSLAVVDLSTIIPMAIFGAIVGIFLEFWNKLWNHPDEKSDIEKVSENVGDQVQSDSAHAEKSKDDGVSAPAKK